MNNHTVKRRIKKFLLWVEVTLILILGAGMGVVLGAIYQMNKALPPDSKLDEYRPAVGTKIVSSDGTVLGKLAVENREPVSLDRVPKHMQDAIVAIEDSRFYHHSGLDYRGIARAVWVNTMRGELDQGFSTITQQLARNMFLSSRKTLNRKLKEVLYAIQIERNWTKRQILEAYLNQVYFGAGAYGVKSAAQTYFGKRVEDLNLEEAALLAALPQTPSRLSPFAVMQESGNYDRTKSRRDTVLDRMASLGFVTRARARQAKEAPIRVAKQRPRMTGYFKAHYFVQYVVDELREQMKFDEDYLNRAGLTVVTTLNWKMQQVAEKEAREELAKFRKHGRVSEASLICLDPHTGYIRALVGGVNRPWEKYQFDCATQAKRQPGSSFKAFVYAAALEQGHTPYSSVGANVNPIALPDGSVYAPKNHGRHGGSMSYVSAFASSVNGAAVNVGMQVGPRKVKEMAHKLGIKSRVYAYPSISLGVSECTALEMASAYGVFAARGRRAEPLAILQIRDQGDRVIHEFHPKVSDMGLKPSTIAGMDVLTRAVVTSGTGTTANIVPNAHGKTGTSEKHTDAWFLGYTPHLVTAVWAGNRDNSPMQHLYGGTVAAPIWAKFMVQAEKLNPDRKKKPAGWDAAALKPPPPPRPRVRRRTDTDTARRPTARSRKADPDDGEAAPDPAPAPPPEDQAPTEPAPVPDKPPGDGDDDD